MESQTDNEQQLTVFDIDADMTAEDMACLLNERCNDGRYLLTVMPWGTGARVILRRHALQVKRPPREPKPKAEDVAMDFIRANRELSLAKLQVGIGALGCRRSIAWIDGRRRMVLQSARLKT